MISRRSILQAVAGLGTALGVGGVTMKLNEPPEEMLKELDSGVVPLLIGGLGFDSGYIQCCYRNSTINPFTGELEHPTFIEPVKFEKNADLVELFLEQGGHYNIEIHFDGDFYRDCMIHLDIMVHDKADSQYVHSFHLPEKLDSAYSTCMVLNPRRTVEYTYRF